MGMAVVLALPVGIGMAIAPTPAAADGARKSTVKNAVEIVLVQFKVVKDGQGREQLIAADSVKPGDVLEYRATYTNRTGKAVTGLVANLPLPEGLEYLPKTAKPGPALVKAAANNGQFAVEPLSRVVNGRAEPVPYSEYRALRWTLGQLPANGVTAVSARARVETVAAPVQAKAAPVVVSAKSASETSTR